MKISFEVYGDPMGKQRPRVVKIGNNARTYTPKETINYETKVVYAFKQAQGEYLADKELKATITAYYRLQKVHYGKKGINKKGLEKLEGKINPTTKPDCDNIAKICLDALNGVAYYDDSQITELQVFKKYAEAPKVVIELETKEQKE